MTRIAVLTGGTSSERGIALLSAQNVAEALRANFEVDIFDFPLDLQKFVETRAEFTAVVPVFHGKGGEDGAIQGFLKTLDIPFIFSDVTAHAVGMNKLFTKKIAIQSGLQTPAYLVLTKKCAPEFVYPVVVKPIDGGSSLGVSIAKSQQELNMAAEKALTFSDAVLIEDYVSGEEYTVAVIDERGKTTALPLIQIKSKHEFFDYESKYDAALCEEICPAPAPEELTQRLQEAGVIAHEMIGARHISRSDFIVDRDGTIWFLEINTIPGQTLNSLVPKAVRVSGRNFGALLKEWVEQVTRV